MRLCRAVWPVVRKKNIYGTVTNLHIYSILIFFKSDSLSNDSFPYLIILKSKSNSNICKKTTNL
jgi:hypothetical protein